VEFRDDIGERTYEPTPLRLKEARRRGLAARSGDVVAVAGWLGAMVLLFALGGPILEGLRRMTALALDGADCPAGGPAQAGRLLWEGLGPVLALAAAMGAALVAVAAAANLVQVGFMASTEVVQADFTRLSPGRGLKRLLSGRSAFRGAMACVKVAAAGAAAAWVLREALPRIAGAAALAPADLAGEAGSLALRMALAVGLALAGPAVADWLYQRWRLRQDLKMTRREYLDDLRRMEGDGQVRRRQRRLARAWWRSPKGECE